MEEKVSTKNNGHMGRWVVGLLGTTLVGLLILSIVVVAPAFAQGPGGFGGMMRGRFDGHSGFGMFGQSAGAGHCGGFIPPAGVNLPDPLSIEETEQAVEQFLEGYGDPNLELAEVVIFDNGGYAEIVEVDTGIGAMEVLIDPWTLNVYPEMGPNMMWNTRYGMMGGHGGMMGGMMGNWDYGYRNGNSGELTITPEEAGTLAQEYLDQVPWGDGLTANDHADAFYGYYTLHVLSDGEIIGMLSVNGYTSQVWYHTWHGDFIEMSDPEH